MPISYKKSQQYLDDGKFNDTTHAFEKFPGYLLDNEHPFGICNALSHTEYGIISNKWSGTDGPENFENNLKTKSVDWKYRTKKVEYRVNASGYRTREWDEIDWKNSIVILGCSMTYGQGLAEDETLSYQLEQLTGRPVINLGYPAASNELILNNYATLINKFGDPYAVVINWSGIDRLQYFTETIAHNLGLWNSADDQVASHGQYIVDYWKMTVFKETNIVVKNYNIANVAKAMARGRSKYVSVSLFLSSAHYMRTDGWFEQIDLARDGAHPGYETIKLLTNLINNKLNEQL